MAWSGALDFDVSSRQELFSQTRGDGDDLLVFSDGGAADTIRDFTAGDVIDLTGETSINSFADVQAAASQVGADVLIDMGAGDSVTLLGVDLTDLHQDDFLFSVLSFRRRQYIIQSSYRHSNVMVDASSRTGQLGNHYVAALRRFKWNSAQANVCKRHHVAKMAENSAVFRRWPSWRNLPSKVLRQS